MHTGGEPVRIVVSGYPLLEGDTILEKRNYAKDAKDHFRKMLMFEPRGHHDMYGVLLVKPDNQRADIGVLFIHNEGYSTMCGHAVISLGRFAVDYNYVKLTEPETQVNIQCPCGLVKTTVECKDGKTGAVRFESVVAFVSHTGLQVEVPGYGLVTVDIVYGGAFYAIITDTELGVNVVDSTIEDIANAGQAVTSALQGSTVIEHPDSEDLSFLYGTIITDGKDEWHAEKPTSSICIFAEKQVDRSPCGSGTTGRVALQYHKGQIGLGQQRIFKNSKTMSQFTATALREATLGKYKGVVVEVKGHGYYTGEGLYIREAKDDLGRGFLIN
ncbi:hypothetical protein BSL78_29782 [Apostichopus japonicus]|uniref:trans-L-3-hydroxyproline dehydratase n=1 Tax=Stichopus japonicus TaxID=307972 RepID=A0A2G8JCD2_STIJA|nr:hypothetical protein BSL78_29782 [Apostichopus japonicus]